MGVSKWFDYKVYLNNKLAQLVESEPDAGWTPAKLLKALTDAGFTPDEAGAFAHFEQYGQYEDVAPNAFFNAEEYYRAKAVQATGKTDSQLDEFDVAAIKQAINTAGMNAWSHYEQHGSAEGVNPSNSFDTEAYLTAKLDALKASEPTAGWDMPKLNQALRDAGLSALEHFLMYAGTPSEGTEGLTVDGKIPAKFQVAPEKQVTPGGSEGHSFSLSTGADVLTSTQATLNNGAVTLPYKPGAGNDVFTAGDTNALSISDVIDGAGGNNTLRFFGVDAGTANFASANVKNVQNVELLGGGTATANSILDTSKNADVKNVIIGTGTFTGAQHANITMSLDQTLTLKGEIATTDGSGSHITYAGADKGAADSVNLVLDNLNIHDGTAGANDSVLVIADVENITMTLKGDNAFTGSAAGPANLVATSLEALTLTGSGTLSMGIASGNTALKTIDAKNAGGVDLVFEDLGDNAAFKSFTGSTNDDTITVSGGDIASGMTFTGGDGDGTDTLKLTTAAADKAAVKGVTGFEVFELGANFTQDLSWFKDGNAFESIVISGELAGGSGLSGISGEAQQDIRFVADQTKGALALATSHSALAPQTAKIVLDNITLNDTTAGLDITELSFNNVGSLTIESLSNTVHGLASGSTAGSGQNSIFGADGVSGLTATSAEKIFVTGNDSLLLNLTKANTALKLVDASELGKDITTGTKPGLFLTVADDTLKTTNLSIIGSAGDDFIKLVETAASSGDELFAYKYTGGDDKIGLTTGASGSLSLKLDEATLGTDSVLKAGSLTVAGDLADASITKAGGSKIVIDFSTDVADTFVRNGVDFAIAASASGGSSWDTKVAEGKTFNSVNGAYDNLAISAGVSGGFLIQIDVNGDGKFTAADDFQISIVGTNTAADLGIAYAASTGDITITSGS